MTEYNLHGEVKSTTKGMIQWAPEQDSLKYSISANSEAINLTISGNTIKTADAEIEEINDDQIIIWDDISEEDEDTVKENLSKSTLYQLYYGLFSKDPFKVFEEEPDSRGYEDSEDFRDDEDRWRESEDDRRT